MLQLRLAKHIAERYQELGTVHLPDFLIYDFDEEEYHLFWQEIFLHPRERLYTDGLFVFRVSWFRSIFEMFKGWLGFEDHCHPNRVELTLAKIAYAGYLKGFNAGELTEANSNFPISMRFIGLIKSKRTNETSRELQRLLMGYFITHSPAFPEFDDSQRKDYPFGQTFVQEYLAYLLPSIDPQDSKTIKNAIDQINNQNQWVSKTSIFKSSPFAEAYAQSLATQNRLEEALEWSVDVKDKFKEPFIDFYLSNKETVPQALHNAVDLISKLSLSTSPEDQENAVDYIKYNFNYEEQTIYLKPYPELRRQVAKRYLDDAKNQKNEWKIIQLFTRNKTLEYLAQAISLEPTILNQDDSLHDIMMKDEWTIYQFDLAIERGRFQDADALFSNNQNLKIDKYKHERLRVFYHNRLISNEAQIKEALLKQNTKVAAQLSEEQIELAKKIVRIKPHPSLVMEVSLSYASTLLAIDELEHPIKEADRNQLNRAQHRISEYQFLNNNTNLLQIYNKLLLRKIDSLIARLGVPIDYRDRLSVRTDFVKEHILEIEELKKELKAFINLNESKSKDRQLLAKMYYLFADTLVYFEEKLQESISYFKKARDLMPENLYYNFRYLQITDDERRHSMEAKIEDLGFMHGTKYHQYMTERWNEHRIMSNGFDIHAVVPDDSFLSSITRAVGL